MRRKGLHIFIFSATLFFQSFTFAQIHAKATIDRNNILVGEPVKLTLQASIPKGKAFTWFKTDSIPHIEFIDKGRIDTLQSQSSRSFQQQLTITSYDSGHWTIPSFYISSGKQKIKTDTLAINVTYSTPDSLKDYHDIKEIIEVNKPSNKLFYFITGGILVLILLGLYLWNKRKVPLQTKKILPSLDPYEEAVRSLKELSKTQAVESKEIKLYYSRLNDILRIYLMRRFNLRGMELTNDELLLQLRTKNMNNDEFSKLGQVLRLCDFVKFAKFTPSASDTKEAFNTIQNTINRLEEQFNKKENDL